MFLMCVNPLEVPENYHNNNNNNYYYYYYHYYYYYYCCYSLRNSESNNPHYFRFYEPVDEVTLGGLLPLDTKSCL